MKNTLENTDWMHEILDFTGTGLWRILLDNNTGEKLMYASHSMLVLLGLERHPMPEDCYNHWFSRIGKEYIDYVQGAVAKMLATKEQVELQYIWKHPEQGDIFVRCSGKLQKEEDGCFELQGFHQNITETESYRLNHSASEEEMQNAQKISVLKNRTKRLSEQTVSWKNLVRTILSETNTFEIYYYPKKRLMIFPEEIAKARNWKKEYTNMPQSFSKENIDPECQEIYETMFEQIHEGVVSTNCEVSIGGGKQWYQTNFTIIEHDDEGKPLFLIGVVEDITEKKINQLENLQLQNIYKFTINNDYECLLIIDLESNQYSIRYTDTWKMVDVSEENLMMESFRDFLSKSIQPRDLMKFELNHIISCLNNKEDNECVIWYTDLNHEHKEACCYWIEEDKKILITVRNVEKRWVKERENKQKILEALEMAEAANQAKSDFLSRISHDIRTPLNAVVGMVAIAKKYKNDASKVEECLDSITNSSSYLTSLINDVLDMAKIENEKMRLSKEEFNMDDFLSKMLNIVNPLMDTRKHNFIVTRGDMPHHRVIGDPVRLQQLLLNILSNAVKYTNTGGTVEFMIQELHSDKENYALYQFDVKDNGIGMDEMFLEKLFSPFERKDSERVSHIEGTGLGMSIAKNIANLMEGDIMVTSEVNKGSHFIITVYMELQEGELNGIAIEQEEKKTPDFNGKNILLVEDNAVNMMIAEEILSVTGANIETAENGKEAIQKAEQSSEGYYSLIFMDIRMPIMNGYEAVTIIRHMEREDMRKIPIIAMTADAFIEDIKRAKDCGMNDHIAKPIDIDKLYDVMRKFEKAQ